MRFRCYRLRGNIPLFVLDWGRTFGFHAHETRPAGETMEIRKEAWKADLAEEVWPLSSFRPRLGGMGYDENVRFGGFPLTSAYFRSSPLGNHVLLLGASDNHPHSLASPLVKRTKSLPVLPNLFSIHVPSSASSAPKGKRIRAAYGLSSCKSSLPHSLLKRLALAMSPHRRKAPQIQNRSRPLHYPIKGAPGVASHVSEKRCWAHLWSVAFPASPCPPTAWKVLTAKSAST